LLQCYFVLDFDYLTIAHQPDIAQDVRDAFCASPEPQHTADVAHNNDIKDANSSGNILKSETNDQDAETIIQHSTRDIIDLEENNTASIEQHNPRKRKADSIIDEPIMNTAAAAQDSTWTSVSNNQNIIQELQAIQG
jgi:hypothetical protein